MLVSSVIRWLGMCAVLGGICRVLMTPIELAWGVDNTVALLIGGLTGSIFIILGTAGIYLYQAEKTGILGFLGFIITSIGNILVCSMVLITLFVNTALKQPQILEQDLSGPIIPIRIIMLIGISLGYILLGYVTLRAKMLPSWAGALMILFVILSFIPFTGNYIAVVWGLFYIGLGWAAWAKSDVSESKTKYLI
jgi:hypothetical protein